ncbi:MAG: class I SAM-dependent methyltransferase [Acidobacteriota bacterium]
MQSLRQSYYDAFSAVYDGFVSLHSRDSQRLVREFLAGLIPAGGSRAVLDLCTGTGTLLSHLSAKAGPEGLTVGLDFSRGMLRRARAKTAGDSAVRLVRGRAESLPFPSARFQAVTCSHAFYELKGAARERALAEIVRVLEPGGVFLMMEHAEPASQPAKALFHLRLAVAGGARARRFLEAEQTVLEGRFGAVEKVLSPSGRSKVMVCKK